MTFLSLAFGIQILRITLPYLFAAQGGLLSERAGIVHLGLEGVMLLSAFGGILGAHYFHHPLAGVALGLSLGVLLNLLHGYVCIKLKANHIISGVALNLLAVGISEFFLKALFDSSSNSPRVEHLGTSLLPQHSSPLVREVLANPYFWSALLLVFALHYGLFHTRFGLRLRAIGEEPLAPLTLGVPTARMRFWALGVSGAITALGGLVLSFDQHQFTNGMTGGRGFIAIAAMIFGRWSPWGAAGACLLFGAAEAVQINLQTQSTIPAQFIQMIPYALTLLAIASTTAKSRAPKNLGRVLSVE